MGKVNQKPSDLASDGNALSSALRTMIGNYSFIDIVRVEEVTGNTLTVRSLLLGMSVDKTKIDNEAIHNIPYLRLQRGLSAVIMDPVVGDIGLMAVCDKDATNVKASGEESIPATLRTHSAADGVYLTGIASLNADPTQYARFTEAGIDIVSPVKVTVTGPDIAINGDSKVEINSPDIILNGPISQGAGSYAGAAHFKNTVTSDTEVSVGNIHLTSHGHSGVQGGSDNSGGPVPL